MEWEGKARLIGGGRWVQREKFPERLGGFLRGVMGDLGAAALP